MLSINQNILFAMTFCQIFYLNEEFPLYCIHQFSKSYHLMRMSINSIKNNLFKSIGIIHSQLNSEKKIHIFFSVVNMKIDSYPSPLS